MAVPKKRTSKSRKNKRKIAWKNKVKNYSLTVPFTMQFHKNTYLPWEIETKKNLSFKGFKKSSDDALKIED